MKILYVLDKQGNPRKTVNLSHWLKWMENNDRNIANDKIRNVRVSTVFLGIDHSQGRGEPLLYETMVFGGKHDGYEIQYTTREKALEGHAEAIAMVKQDGVKGGIMNGFICIKANEVEDGCAIECECKIVNASRIGRLQLLRVAYQVLELKPRHLIEMFLNELAPPTMASTSVKIDPIGLIEQVLDELRESEEDG